MNRREFMTVVAAGCAAASVGRAEGPFGGDSGIVPLPAESNARERGAVVLRPFDYRGVKLLPSHFQRQVEYARNLYFNLSNDDLLKGFRRDAGLPAPGNDLKGWAKGRADATFGQWISGMARLSCALNDAPLRAKAIALTEGWKQTLSPTGNPKTNTYGWEKFACGLVDMALYADYDRDLTLLQRITEWASKSFDRSRTPATPLDRDGHEPHGTLEWYTLSEQMYRAYLLTGKALFRDFAQVWHYDSYWNKFERSPSPEGVAFLHSYSHVNTFSGVVAAYRVTGNERYLRILRNAQQFVVNTQAYASGAYGPGEWSVPADGTLGRAIEIRSDSAEVPCDTWACFKLSKALVSFTGDASYVDWMESMLYNGIGAALPVQADGRAYYYADYRLGTATKLYHWDEWPCCSGTYLQDIADYHDLIYFYDPRGIAVALFVPSEVTWAHGGQPVTLRQESTFPEGNEVTFSVRAATAVQMAVRIRIPPWSGAVTLLLNGQPADVPRPVAGQWLTVDRRWLPTDKLVVRLDPQLRLVPVDVQHPRRAAVKYGPVLLAQEARFTMPLEVRDGEDLRSRFTRSGQELAFTVSDVTKHEQGTGSFRPLYEVAERLPYRVYFDVDKPRFL